MCPSLSASTCSLPLFSPGDRASGALFVDLVVPDPPDHQRLGDDFKVAARVSHPPVRLAEGRVPLGTPFRKTRKSPGRRLNRSGERLRDPPPHVDSARGPLAECPRSVGASTSAERAAPTTLEAGLLPSTSLFCLVRAQASERGSS